MCSSGFAGHVTMFARSFRRASARRGKERGRPEERGSDRKQPGGRGGSVTSWYYRDISIRSARMTACRPWKCVCSWRLLCALCPAGVRRRALWAQSTWPSQRSKHMRNAQLVLLEAAVRISGCA